MGIGMVVFPLWIGVRAHKDPSDLLELSRNPSQSVCVSLVGDPGLGCPLGICSQLWLHGSTMGSATAAGAIPIFPSVQTGWKLPRGMMKAAFPEKGSTGGLDVWDSKESSDWTNEAFLG